MILMNIMWKLELENMFSTDCNSSGKLVNVKNPLLIKFTEKNVGQYTSH